MKHFANLTLAAAFAALFLVLTLLEERSLERKRRKRYMERFR